MPSNSKYFAEQIQRKCAARLFTGLTLKVEQRRGQTGHGLQALKISMVIAEGVVGYLPL
jgi:hypothetical protein